MQRFKRLIAILAVIGSGLLIAQTVPSGMTYQGRLTDASNAPVPDGTGYEIEVRLWSASTGGTLLWGTRYTGVPLKSGAFNLILGSGGTPIPGSAPDLKSAFNNPSVHLGLTTTKSATGAAIPSPTEILPRQQIFSTPYAFRSETAATVQLEGVNSAAIKDGEVKSTDIGANEVKLANLASSSVDSTKLALNSVSASHIALPGLTADKLDFEFASFVDQKPTNTGGGAWTLGWVKRTLNTTSASKGSSISRNGDTITLNYGIYWIHALVPIYHASQIAFIRDTAGNSIMRGTSEHGGYYQTKYSIIEGPLVVSTSTLDVELWSNITNAVLGPDRSLGIPANISGIPEQYTKISVVRIK